MPLVYTRSRVVTQPNGPVEIDWEHPFARGLKVYMLPGISTVNLASRSLRALTGGITNKVGNFGRGACLNADANGIALGSDLFGNGAMSLYAACLWNTDTFGYLLSSNYDGSNEPASLRFNGGQMEAGSYQPNTIAFIGGGTTAGNFRHCFGTWTGTGASQTVRVAVFELGVSSAFTTTSSGTLPTRNGFSWWALSGANVSTPWRAYQSQNAFVLAGWDGRELNLGEMREFSRNPYQILRPRQPLIFWDLGGGDQSISVSDTSAGSDALAIAAALALGDTSAGSDALAIAVGLALGDTGSGADSLAGAAAVPIVDSASAVDVIAATASLSITDVGTAGDALTIAVALAVADTGTGADAVTVITATLISIADALAGTDSLTISAAAALSDTGAGVDATQIAAALSVADSGAGTDAVSVITATLKAVADSAAGTDALAIAVQVQLSDAGFATELLAITALVSVLETASGMDVAVRFDSQVKIATVTFSTAKRSITFSE